MFEICSKINFPVAYDKTCWASPIIKFLGLLLNGMKRIIMVPEEKRSKAIAQINTILEARKIKMIQVQQIAGLLNFICRAIVPGRAFTRRLYTKTSGLKQFHHLKVDGEMRKDLFIWLQFLEQEESQINRPFIDLNKKLLATEVQFFTDASKKVGFGGFCQGSYFWGEWESASWVKKNNVEIAWMELYAVTVGIILFAQRFQNKRIVLFCDNQSVVGMLNNASSTCKRCMILIRIITLISVRVNARFFAKYIKTSRNKLADALSRKDWKKILERSSKLHREKTNSDSDRMLAHSKGMVGLKKLSIVLIKNFLLRSE